MHSLDPTRDDVVAILQRDWIAVIAEAQQHANKKFEQLRKEGPSQVILKFLKDGQEYGQFDLHSIKVGREIEQEVCDIVGYTGVGFLQSQHGPPPPEGI